LNNRHRPVSAVLYGNG